MIHTSERPSAAPGTRALSALEASSVSGSGGTYSVAVGIAFNGAINSMGTYVGQIDPATVTGHIEAFGKDGTGGFFVWHETIGNFWGFWADTPDGHDNS